MRSHQSSRNFGYKAKEYNFRLKLFTAAGLPLPSLQDTTSQLIWQATERIARKNTSPLNQQDLQDLQVVITMRKATLEYFESQNESDVGHFLWIEFLERVYKALRAKIESLISIDYETNEMRARLRELDLKEGRRATSIGSVLTDSMTVDSRESVPTELKSLKVSGDEVVTILQFKTLQDLQSTLGKIWRKAALGELDLVTTAEISNIIREYAQERLGKVSCLNDNTLGLMSCRHHVAAEIIEVSREQNLIVPVYREITQKSMSWPPLTLQIAKDVKAIDDTVRLDLWLLSAAIHGWNGHDDEGCQARRHSALRFGLMTHVQQLNDFYQNIPMLCLDGTQELIKDAWELLRCGNSKQLDPWSTCHLCAILAVKRALAEEMVLGKYGPMVLYGYHRFKFAGLPFAKSQLIVTLQRRLYPQGVPQKQQDFNTWFTKLNSAKNFDRRFQAIRAQVPLGVLLQGEDYRTSGLIERLRKAKSPIAEEQDLLKLLDRFQQVLTTENETMYLLNGQGAKTLKEKAEDLLLHPDLLKRIEDDEDLKWRSIT